MRILLEPLVPQAIERTLAARLLAPIMHMRARIETGPSTTPMLTHPAVSRIAARLPRLFSGTRLHRMALHASYFGQPPLAERLFEAAALRYREDLRVEALARLRVHQLMTRARRRQAANDRTELALEIERRLTCLDTIESIVPPFAAVEARSMLANWLGDGPAADRPQARAA